MDTNGLKMAESEEYCKEIESAGTSVVYLQFDAVTEEPYEKLRGQKLLAVKKKFAIENSDIIRGVNFQPVSFCDRTAYDKNRKITSRFLKKTFYRIHKKSQLLGLMRPPFQSSVYRFNALHGPLQFRFSSGKEMFIFMLYDTIK